MSRTLAQIQEDIQKLSVPEMERLLRSLWEQLDGTADSDVDGAWREEARRRDQEIEQGDVESVPADEVF